MIKVFVSYIDYESQEAHVGQILTSNVSDESFLRIILDVYGYGWVEEEQGELTIDKFYDELYENNGDGCNLIISIITEEGDVIFTGDGDKMIDL